MRAFNAGAPAGCRAGYITEGQSLARACSQLHPDLSYLSFQILLYPSTGNVTLTSHCSLQAYSKGLWTLILEIKGEC